MENCLPMQETTRTVRGCDSLPKPMTEPYLAKLNPEQRAP